MAQNAEDFIVTFVQKISGPDIGGAIGQLAAKLGAGQSKLKSFGDALQKLSPQADAAGNGLNQGRDALGRFTAAGTGAQGMLGQLGGALSALGPYGMAAAVALAAVTAAALVTIGALTAMAAAAISVVQTRAAMLATFSALGGGAAQGKATLEMVERLGERLPFTTEQIGTWAKSLQAAGLQGKALESGIKAVAAATALMGESGGAAAENMIAKLAEGGKGADALLKQIQQGAGRSNKALAEMGLTSADVAKALGKTPEQLKTAKVSAAEMQKAIETALRVKGGGALEQLGSTFPVMIGKAKEGLLSLFDGLGPSVQPFMSAVKSLFGEFSKGGNVIKILKPIFQSVFSTLFEWGQRAVTFLHDGFQQVMIAGLKVYIALHPLIARIQEFAKSETFIRGLKIAFGALAVAVFISALPFIVLGAAVLIVIGLFVALVAGAIWLAGAIGGFVVAAFNKVRAAVKSFSLPNLAAAAKNMIASFISAIVGGIGQVVSAMLAMGGAAKKALFSALGIASPSKIAVEAATNVTSTFSDTVDDGKGKTQAAFAGMAKNVDASGGAKRGGSGSGGALDRLAAAVDKLADRMGEGGGAFAELLQEAMATAAGEGSG